MRRANIMLTFCDHYAEMKQLMWKDFDDTFFHLPLARMPFLTRNFWGFRILASSVARVWPHTHWKNITWYFIWVVYNPTLLTLNSLISSNSAPHPPLSPDPPHSGEKTFLPPSPTLLLSPLPYAHSLTHLFQLSPALYQSEERSNRNVVHSFNKCCFTHWVPP